MNTSLPYHISEPPARLKKARLDNIALVPASLLPLKGTYQLLANNLPTGSVLAVPGNANQQRIIDQVKQFFRSHGRAVITYPLEKFTRKIQKARPRAENLTFAF